MKKITGLIIMDGFGVANQEYGNAIKNADISYIPSLMKNYPYVTLGASGMDVGLPDGQMGNSEVGHLNIGAGRIVYQELTRITKSIKDGDFFENNELLTAIRQAKQKAKTPYLRTFIRRRSAFHIEHLFALIKMAKKKGWTIFIFIVFLTEEMCLQEAELIILSS